MNIDLDLCVIRLAKGERISPELAEVLDDIDITTIGFYEIPVERPTKLHYHQCDEYWLFTEGNTTVTLKSPDGVEKSYQIGPGVLIATPKGVWHGHTPSTTVKGFEFASAVPEGVERREMRYE